MATMDPQLSVELSSTLEVDFSEEMTLDNLRNSLAVYLDKMATNTPEKLVQLLYRVDISEKKLKAVLAASKASAGQTMADMIITRQIEKLKAKDEYKKDPGIPDNERW